MGNQAGLWSRIEAALAPSEADKRVGEALFEDYQGRGYLHKTCREMVGMADGAIAGFYRQLETLKTAQSPVQNRADAGWMVEADFCFINVRATGVDKKTGTFLQAAKLLPILRANAIHLAPFTLCDFGIVYAVSSVRTISRKLLDAGLVEKGFSAEDQLRALVQAAHLLDKTVGFDIEPHVAQFAIPVLMEPECFRWIKLSEQNKQQLDYGLSNDEMMRQEVQGRIAAAVREMVQTALRDAGLDDLEIVEGDGEEKIRFKTSVFHGLIKRLIAQGYWTVLSHSWAGVGVPGFRGYHARNYPEFLYLDKDGKDRGDNIYGVLTPFSFYHDLPVNRLPDARLEVNEVGMKHFCSIFDYWRDEFGFDFVRYDSVDHIFDSVVQHDGNWPASDRPTPEVLRRCIATSKSAEKPYIGNMAERMGNEIWEYAGVGYDVMLGTDMFGRVNRAQLEKSFWIHEQLVQVNATRETPFAVVYAIDTHDTGNPHLWGEALLKVVGSKGVQVRHFLSRFLSCGTGRRPKYEVMGVQDMSYGLYEANIGEKNLVWVGDEGHNQMYHRIEDIYAKFAGFLREARLVHRVVTEDWAWWVMQNGNHWLVPLVALERDGYVDGILPMEIDVLAWVGREDLIVKRYDFRQNDGEVVEMRDGCIAVAGMPRLGFLLFDVEA